MLADEAGTTPPEDNPTARKSHSIFYKFIDQSILAQKHLELPRRFVEIYGGELSIVVYLTASALGMWPVSLRKDNQSVWLRGGWQKFVKDQLICDGCYPVFEYKGRSTFHVDIYNLAAPKINYPHVAPLTLEEFSAGKRFQLPHKKENIDDTDDIMDDHTSRDKPSFSLKNIYDDIHQTSWSSANDPTRSNLTTGFQAAHTPIVLQRMAVATQDVGIQVEENELIENNIRKTNKEVDPFFQAKTHRGKRKAVAEPEREKLIHEARLFKPDRVSFTLTMRPSHVYSHFFVHLPCWFVRKHLSKSDEYIKLQISKGKTWPVRCIFYSDSKAKMSKGWRVFVQENGLEEGDVCTFELVETKNVVLKVSMFRAHQPSNIDMQLE